LRIGKVPMVQSDLVVKSSWSRGLFVDRLLAGVVSSGVAKPLAVWGGGQICRSFFLGFGKWRAV